MPGLHGWRDGWREDLVNPTLLNFINGSFFTAQLWCGWDPLRKNCLRKYCLNLVIDLTGGLDGHFELVSLSMPTLILSVGQLSCG